MHEAEAGTIEMTTCRLVYMLCNCKEAGTQTENLGSKRFPKI